MSDTNASVKALRALLRGDPFPPDAADLPQHLKEISGTNDRLLAIVCGTMVDLALAQLLRSVMYKGEGKLFDVNQPLSTFSSKIALAYSLGLIDDDVRRNADYIREIRNVFAHRLAPTNFRTREVAGVCKLLKLGELEGKKNTKTNMRTRYVAAATRTGKVISARATKGIRDIKDRLQRGDPPLPPASLP
jgi:DNA-binding MltR family transcriptional regulator